MILKKESGAVRLTGPGVINLRIKKISKDEVVVYLSIGDLELFDLSPDSFEPKSVDLHRFLFILMETVREETGFDPYDGQVVVEAARVDGGIHLSISKVAGSNRKISRAEFSKVKRVRVKGVRSGHAQKHDLRREFGDITDDELYEAVFANSAHRRLSKREAGRKKDNTFVFVFSTYSDLESALCIADRSRIANGELYRDGKRYALILRMRSMDGCYNISEFTENVLRSGIAADKVREAWKKVAEGEALSEMADALKNMI